MFNGSQLETFIVVAEEKSFAKASEKLYISSTSIINQINLLESEIEVKLFHRNHNGVVLTQEGEEFYEDAKYILNYSEKSIEKIQKMNRNNQNLIRVGISPMTPIDDFVKIWGYVKKEYNNFNMEIISFDNVPSRAKEILINLGQEMDIVLGVYDKTFLSERMCSAMKLKNQNPICLFPKEHRLSTRRIVSFDDLKGETILLSIKGQFEGMDKIRDEILRKYNNIKIEDVYFFNLDIFNKSFLENKVLIAPGNLINVHPLLNYKELAGNYSSDYGIIHSINPNRYIKKFLKIVEELNKKYKIIQ